MIYTKENLYSNTVKPETLEDYQNWFEVYKSGKKRQHGRTGASQTDPVKELARLKSNYQCLVSRYRKKLLEKAQDDAIRQAYERKKTIAMQKNAIDMQNLLNKHERMYRAKFKNCPIGSKVHLSYMIRMTGFDLDTIYMLQQKTGLCCVPKVSKKQAEDDKKKREREGITGIIG